VVQAGTGLVLQPSASAERVTESGVEGWTVRAIWLSDVFSTVSGSPDHC
jgi:hypothetical protein